MERHCLGVEWNAASWAFAGLFAARLGVELVVDLLQAAYLARRDERRVPRHLAGKVDPETIAKAVRYNRDRLRLRIATRFYEALPVWALILFGFAALDRAVGGLGWGPLVSGLAFVGTVGVISGIWGLPPQLISVFGVEAHYGFNRQSLAGFAVDKLKGAALGVVIGGALVSAVLALMDSVTYWWLVAFGAVAAVQLVVAWIYPLAIMPLFNRLTPVDGDLARDVSDLAGRVGFPLAGVVKIDGSRRTAHSNAFIIGLIGARRIVLYDTLIDALERQELLAVLAHELGHFKLGHIRRRVLLVLGGMLGLFALFGWMADLEGVYRGLGFAGRSGHAALLIFGLFAGEGLFPVSFLLRRLSVRAELAADRFAVEAMGGGGELSRALVSLTKQNLTSPGSHRFYRGYHNTHPALRERLAAIREQCRAIGTPIPSDDAQVNPAVAPEAGDREDDRDREDAADTDLGHGPGEVDPEPPEVEGDGGETDEQH